MILNKWKRHSGMLLIATGVLHNAVGLALFGGVLSDIARDGAVNALGESPERLSAFWFFVFGFMLMYIGFFANWLLKKQRLPLPPLVGWWLLAVCAAGVVLMPASGFWIGLPQALLILLPGKRAGAGG